MYLLHSVYVFTELLCVIEKTGADVNKLSFHWWIALLLALVLMLVIAVIIFIICFIARTRQAERLRLRSGNNLVVVCTLHVSSFVFTDTNQHFL